MTANVNRRVLHIDKVLKISSRSLLCCILFLLYFWIPVTCVGPICVCVNDNSNFFWQIYAEFKRYLWFAVFFQSASFTFSKLEHFLQRPVQVRLLLLLLMVLQYCFFNDVLLLKLLQKNSATGRLSKKENSGHIRILNLSVHAKLIFTFSSEML